jgi:lysophospholipase L1-like esterase
MKKLILILALIGTAHAQIKISELPAASTINSADSSVLVQSGTTKKAAISLWDARYAAVTANNTWTGSNTFNGTTTFGNATQARSALGLGTLSTQNGTFGNATQLTSGTLPDARLSDAAIVTGVQGGQYTALQIQIDAKGRVTNAYGFSLGTAATSNATAFVSSTNGTATNLTINGTTTFGNATQARVALGLGNTTASGIALLNLYRSPIGPYPSYSIPYIDSTGNAGTLTTGTGSTNLVNGSALSTWSGSGSITTLGTIAYGTIPAALVSGLGTAATQNSTEFVSSNNGTATNLTINGTTTFGNSTQFLSALGLSGTYLSSANGTATNLKIDNMRPVVKFNPASISGLTYWLRGDDISSLSDNATLVAGNLIDRSSNGFSVTIPATLKKITGFDGRAAIRFPSTNTGIVLPGGFVVPKNNHSVYALLRQGVNTQDGSYNVISDLGSGLQCMYWVNTSLKIYDGGSNPTGPNFAFSQENYFLTGYRASSNSTMMRYNQWTYKAAAMSSGNLTGGTIGSSSNGTYSLAGDLQEFIVFNRALTDDEDASMVAYFNSITTPMQIICPGDSNTYGWVPDTYTTSKANGYPWKLNRLIPQAKVINWGVPSQTLATQLGLLGSQVTNLFDSNAFPAGNIVCFCDPGANDIAGNSTASSIYSNLVSYCGSVKSAGGKIVISTILPRSGTNNFNASQETVRQTYNTTIRANWSKIADALVDLDADTVVGGVGASSNTTYYSTDGIHRTAAGNQVIANAFAKAVIGLNQANSLTSLTDNSTITQVCDSSKPIQMGAVTLGGNRTLSITKSSAGMRGLLFVTQDATGNRTLTLPSGSVVSGGGNGTMTLSTTPNAKDRLSWDFDGSNYYWSSSLNFN